MLSERQRVQGRLESILGNVEPALANNPNFYTVHLPDEREKSLIVLFNAGIDPDPAYSSTTTARLHLTDKGDFCFTWWPLSKEGYRTETLLSDVRHLEWEFLGLKADQEWGWLKEWPKAMGGIPSIVRLNLWCGIDKKKKREPNLQFAFILTNQEPVAVLK